MRRTFFLLVMLVMAGTVLQNFMVLSAKVLLVNLQIRAEWCNKDLIRDVKVLVKKKYLAGLKRLAEGLIHPRNCCVERPSSRYIEALTALGQNDLFLKKKSVVFIPRDQTFWGNACSIGLCIYVPLYVPAVSGIALLNGMPTAPCDLRWTFGYLAEYSPYSVLKNEKNAICTEARTKGFENVFVIENSNIEKISVRQVLCSNA